MLWIQEHRTGRVGTSPPHPWLKLPSDFGTQQAEQGWEWTWIAFQGSWKQLLVMMREGGSHHRARRGAVCRFTAFLLSASEQGHITPGITSHALGAAPISHPSSGVLQEAGGRISIPAT